MSLFLGLDIGTSGIRTSVIDDGGKLISSTQTRIPIPITKGRRKIQSPLIWWSLVKNVIILQGKKLEKLNISPRNILSISIDGTSGTILLIDKSLNPITHAEMYSSGGFEKQVQLIEKYCPNGHITSNSSSSLAKLLFLKESIDVKEFQVLHQADWIASKLRAGGFYSDDNNSLKLGFDLLTNSWPTWITDELVDAKTLPEVLRPGENTGNLNSEVAKELNLSENCQVISGTTDSIASFLAHEVQEEGEAVTSLGSTLAIKLFSKKPLNHKKYGIYSHRILDKWLVGGASNTGGQVLRKYFNDKEIKEFQKEIEPSKDSGLSYYPLTEPGERFPIYDPKLKPNLFPRPKDNAKFLHGILEGISVIEKRCFSLLESLGASKITKVFTSGGGAESEVWRSIREQNLSVPVLNNPDKTASLGSAKLSLIGYRSN